VQEARLLTEAAKKAGVVTQMGNQIQSYKEYRTAVRLVHDGAIGKVKEVLSWQSGVPRWPRGIDRPPGQDVVPGTLHWDNWLGVAPTRPYKAKIYHDWNWRAWQDFSNGQLGDFGCHILDPVFTALEITGDPIDVVADHTGMNDEVWPAQNSLTYTFPGTKYTTGRELKITWDDGGRLPSVRGSHVPPTTALPGSGSLFIGEAGSLVLPHYAAPRLYPQEKFADYNVEPAESRNHYHGWIDGCLSGVQPSDDFEYGGRLTEAVLLGNIAVRHRGQKLAWDAESLRIANHDDANRYVTKDYRDGWQIEPVA
jgi:hypothetical protein